MSSLKPLDEEAILQASKKTGLVISVEEHSIHNGLGAAVAETLSEEVGIRQKKYLDYQMNYQWQVKATKYWNIMVYVAHH